MEIGVGKLARWVEILDRAFEKRDWDRVAQVIEEIEREKRNWPEDNQISP